MELPPLCSLAALDYIQAKMVPATAPGAYAYYRMGGIPAVQIGNVATTAYYEYAACPGNPAIVKYKAVCLGGVWMVNPAAAGIPGWMY